MKKFSFASGIVQVESKQHQHSKKYFWQVSFIGHGLFGWAISKKIDEDEYNNFDAARAALFVTKASKMLSVKG